MNKIDHILKILDIYANEKLKGNKLFEIRKNDRNFKVLDIIQYKVIDKNEKEIDHPLNNKTFIITYITNYEQKENYIVYNEKEIIEKKEYLLYIRIYDIFENDYVLKVRRVKTDNIYRVIGKIYCSTLEQIKRIDYVINSKEHEEYWKEHNIPIYDYQEKKLYLE